MVHPLPHPTDYLTESQRLLRTLCDTEIAVLVTLLAGLFTRSTANQYLSRLEQ